MRKNELDRFRTLQHLPKLEKSPPLWGKNSGTLSAYQVLGKCEIWPNLSLRDEIQIEWRFYSCLITYLETAQLSLLRAFLRQHLRALHEQDWWRSDPRQPISVSQEIIHYTDRWVEFDMMFTSDSDCVAPGKCQQAGILEGNCSRSWAISAVTTENQGSVFYKAVNLQSANWMEKVVCKRDGNMLISKQSDFNVFNCSPWAPPIFHIYNVRNASFTFS